MQTNDLSAPDSRSDTNKARAMRLVLPAVMAVLVLLCAALAQAQNPLAKSGQATAWAGFETPGVDLSKRPSGDAQSAVQPKASPASP